MSTHDADGAPCGDAICWQRRWPRHRTANPGGSQDRVAGAVHLSGLLVLPPADALLGRLARQPGVIALAWHVDYWDRLGWRDPFASREATARQQAYAHRLGSVVFTPALVIDGAGVVVGSDSAAAETAIDAAGTLPVPVTLSRTEDGVAVDDRSGTGPMRALRVVYDPEHATDVAGGENEGARLREYRIVRETESPRRMGRRPAPLYGEDARTRAGPGHPGSVAGSSRSGRGRSATRLIRATRPSRS